MWHKLGRCAFRALVVRPKRKTLLKTYAQLGGKQSVGRPWTDPTWDRERWGRYEYGIGLLGSIKCEEFIDQMSAQLPAEESVLCNYLFSQLSSLTRAVIKRRVYSFQVYINIFSEQIIERNVTSVTSLISKKRCNLFSLRLYR